MCFTPQGWGNHMKRTILVILLCAVSAIAASTWPLSDPVPWCKSYPTKCPDKPPHRSKRKRASFTLALIFSPGSRAACGPFLREAGTLLHWVRAARDRNSRNSSSSSGLSGASDDPRTARFVNSSRARSNTCLSVSWWRRALAFNFR